MAKSANQIQNEITESSIKRISESRRGRGGVNDLPATERLIILYAAAFIEKVQENLTRLNKIDTGTLSTEITQGELTNSNGKYELEIGYPATGKAAKYYDFVNKGVKGFKSGTPDSPYSFKSGFPSINGPMVKAIQSWVKRQGITSRFETQRTTVSGLQKKRKAVSELNKDKSTAWLIAKGIKQKGLAKTGFFDSAVAEYFLSEQFNQFMAKSAAADVRVYIQEANSLINKENK